MTESRSYIGSGPNGWKIGDELRGARASLGKSLRDVQRELHIKSDYIDAIEHQDIQSLPVNAYTLGYLRSYFRYLGLDVDKALKRYCLETGIKSTIAETEFAFGSGRPGAVKSGLGALDVKPTLRIGSGALAAVSFIAGFALLGGLAFSAWSFLQNLQRVSLATKAPQVAVVAVLAEAAAPLHRPSSSLADEAAALALTPAPPPSPPPSIVSPDGPIADIDPLVAGVFAKPAPVEASAIQANELTGPSAASVALAGAPSANAQIITSDDAWVRIQGEGGEILFSGMMGPGSVFELPKGHAGATLKAGNAGAVYVLIGGRKFGPLGKVNGVVKNVSLAAADLRAAYPLADADETVLR